MPIDYQMKIIEEWASMAIVTLLHANDGLALSAPIR